MSGSQPPAQHFPLQQDLQSQSQSQSQPQPKPKKLSLYNRSSHAKLNSNSSFNTTNSPQPVPVSTPTNITTHLSSGFLPHGLTPQASQQHIQPTQSIYQDSFLPSLQPQPLQLPANNKLLSLLNQGDSKYQHYSYPIHQQSRQEYLRLLVLSNPIVEHDATTHPELISTPQQEEWQNDGDKRTTHPKQFLPPQDCFRHIFKLNNQPSLHQNDSQIISSQDPQQPQKDQQNPHQDQEFLPQPYVPYNPFGGPFGPNTQPNLDRFYTERNSPHTPSPISTTTFPYNDPNGFYIESHHDNMTLHPEYENWDCEKQLQKQQVFILARDLAVYEQLHHLHIPFSGTDVGADGVALGQMNRSDDLNNDNNPQSPNTHTDRSKKPSVQRSKLHKCPTNRLFNLLRNPTLPKTTIHQSSHHPQNDTTHHHHHHHHHHTIPYSLTLHQHDAMFGGCYCGIVMLVFRANWSRDVAPVWVYQSMSQPNQSPLMGNDDIDPKTLRLCIPSLLKKGDIFHTSGVKFTSCSPNLVPPKSVKMTTHSVKLTSPNETSLKSLFNDKNQLGTIYPTQISIDSAVHKVLKIHPDVVYRNLIHSSDQFEQVKDQPTHIDKLFQRSQPSSFQSAQTPNLLSQPLSFQSIIAPTQDNTVFDYNLNPLSTASIHSSKQGTLFSSPLLPNEIKMREKLIEITNNSLWSLGTESYHAYLFFVQWVLTYWKNLANLLQTNIGELSFQHLTKNDSNYATTTPFDSSFLSFLPSSPPLLIVDSNSYVVLHPHVAMMATSISKANSCIRQAALQSLFPKSSDELSSSSLDTATLSLIGQSFLESDRVGDVIAKNDSRNDIERSSGTVQNNGQNGHPLNMLSKSIEHIVHPALPSLVYNAMDKLPRVRNQLDVMYSALVKQHRLVVPEWRRKLSEIVRDDDVKPFAEPNPGLYYPLPDLSDSSQGEAWANLHRMLLHLQVPLYQDSVSSGSTLKPPINSPINSSSDSPINSSSAHTSTKSNSNLFPPYSELENQFADRPKLRLSSKTTTFICNMIVKKFITTHLDKLCEYFPPSQTNAASINTDLFEIILNSYITRHYLSSYHFIMHLLYSSLPKPSTPQPEMIAPLKEMSFTLHDRGSVSNSEISTMQDEEPSKKTHLFNIPASFSWAMQRGNIFHAVVQTALLQQNVSFTSLSAILNTVLYDTVDAMISLTLSESKSNKSHLEFIKHLVQQQHNTAMELIYKQLNGPFTKLSIDIPVGENLSSQSPIEMDAITKQFHPKLEVFFLYLFQSAIDDLTSQTNTISTNEFSQDLLSLGQIKPYIVKISQFRNQFALSPNQNSSSRLTSSKLMQDFQKAALQRMISLPIGTNTFRTFVATDAIDPLTSVKLPKQIFRLGQFGRDLSPISQFSTMYNQIVEQLLPSIHIWSLSHIANVFNTTLNSSKPLLNPDPNGQSTNRTNKPGPLPSHTTIIGDSELEHAQNVLSSFLTLQDLNKTSSPFAINHHAGLEQAFFSVFLGLRGRVDALVDATVYAAIPLHQNVQIIDPVQNQMIDNCSIPPTRSRFSPGVPSLSILAATSVTAETKSHFLSSFPPTLPRLSQVQLNLYQTQSFDIDPGDDLVDLRYRQLVPIEIKTATNVSSAHRLQSNVYSMIAHHLTTVPSPYNPNRNSQAFDNNIRGFGADSKGNIVDLHRLPPITVTPLIPLTSSSPPPPDQSLPEDPFSSFHNIFTPITLKSKFHHEYFTQTGQIPRIVPNEGQHDSGPAQKSSKSSSSSWTNKKSSFMATPKPHTPPMKMSYVWTLPNMPDHNSSANWAQNASNILSTLQTSYLFNSPNHRETYLPPKKTIPFATINHYDNCTKGSHYDSTSDDSSFYFYNQSYNNFLSETVFGYQSQSEIHLHDREIPWVFPSLVTTSLLLDTISRVSSLQTDESWDRMDSIDPVDDQTMQSTPLSTLTFDHVPTIPNTILSPTNYQSNISSLSRSQIDSVPLFSTLLSINTLDQYSAWWSQLSLFLKLDANTKSNSDQSLTDPKYESTHPALTTPKIPYRLPLHICLPKNDASTLRSTSSSSKANTKAATPFGSSNTTPTENQGHDPLQIPPPLSYAKTKGTAGNLNPWQLQQNDFTEILSIRNRVATTVHRVESGGDLWSRPLQKLAKSLYNGDLRPIPRPLSESPTTSTSASPNYGQHSMATSNLGSYQDHLLSVTKEIDQLFYPIPKQNAPLYYLDRTAGGLDEIQQNNTQYQYTIKVTRPPQEFRALLKEVIHKESRGKFCGELVDIEDLISTHSKTVSKTTPGSSLSHNDQANASTCSLENSHQSQLQYLSNPISFCDTFEPYSVFGLVPEYNTSLWPRALPLKPVEIEPLFPSSNENHPHDIDPSTNPSKTNSLPKTPPGNPPLRWFNQHCNSCYYTKLCSSLEIAEASHQLLLVPTDTHATSLLASIVTQNDHASKDLTQVSASSNSTTSSLHQLVETITSPTSESSIDRTAKPFQKPTLFKNSLYQRSNSRAKETNAVVPIQPVESLKNGDEKPTVELFSKEQTNVSDVSNWQFAKLIQFTIFYSFLSLVETDPYSLRVANLYGHRQTIFPPYQPIQFNTRDLKIKMSKILIDPPVQPFQSPPPFSQAPLSPPPLSSRQLSFSSPLLRTQSISLQKYDSNDEDTGDDLPSLTFSPVSFGSIGSIDGSAVTHNEHLQKSSVHPVFDMVVTDIEIDPDGKRVHYTFAPYNTLYLLYLKYLEQSLLDSFSTTLNDHLNKLLAPQNTTLGVLNRPLLRENGDEWAHDLGRQEHGLKRVHSLWSRPNALQIQPAIPNQAIFDQTTTFQLFPYLTSRNKLELIQQLIRLAAPINLEDYYSYRQQTYLSARYIPADSDAFEMNSLGQSLRPKSWYGAPYPKQHPQQQPLSQDTDFFDSPSSIHLIPYRYQSPWSTPWSPSPNLIKRYSTGSSNDPNNTCHPIQSIPSSRIYHHNISQGMITKVHKHSITFSTDASALQHDPIYLYLTMLQRFQHIKIPTVRSQEGLDPLLNPGHSFQSSLSFSKLPYTHWRFMLRLDGLATTGTAISALSAAPLMMLMEPLVRELARPVGLLQMIHNASITTTPTVQNDKCDDDQINQSVFNLHNTTIHDNCSPNRDFTLAPFIDQDTGTYVANVYTDQFKVHYNTKDVSTFTLAFKHQSLLPHITQSIITSRANHSIRLDTLTNIVECLDGQSSVVYSPPSLVHSYHYNAPLQIDTISAPSVRIRSLLIDSAPPRLLSYKILPQDPYPIITAHVMHKFTEPSEEQMSASNDRRTNLAQHIIESGVKLDENKSLFTYHQYPIPSQILECSQLSLLVKFLIAIGVSSQTITKIVQYPKTYFLYGFTNLEYGYHFARPIVYFNGHIPFCTCCYHPDSRHWSDSGTNSAGISDQSSVRPPGTNIIICDCLSRFFLYLYSDLIMTLYNICHCDAFTAARSKIQHQNLHFNTANSSLTQETLTKEQMNCLCSIAISIAHRNILQTYDFCIKSHHTLSKLTDTGYSTNSETALPSYSLHPLLFPYLTSVSALFSTIIYKLNFQQRNAIFVGLQSQDWGSIIGLPGSGKSFIISLIIQFFVGLGQRILLTSHTNVSVASVCEKLLNADCEFQPLGSILSTVPCTSTPPIMSSARLLLHTLTHHDPDPKSLIMLNNSDYRLPMFNLAMLMMRFGQSQVNNKPTIPTNVPAILGTTTASAPATITTSTAPNHHNQEQHDVFQLPPQLPGGTILPEQPSIMPTEKTSTPIKSVVQKKSLYQLTKRNRALATTNVSTAVSITTIPQSNKLTTPIKPPPLSQNNPFCAFNASPHHRTTNSPHKSPYESSRKYLHKSPYKSPGSAHKTTPQRPHQRSRMAMLEDQQDDERERFFQVQHQQQERELNQRLKLRQDALKMQLEHNQTHWGKGLSPDGQLFDQNSQFELDGDHFGDQFDHKPHENRSEKGLSGRNHFDPFITSPTTTTTTTTTTATTIPTTTVETNIVASTTTDISHNDQNELTLSDHDRLDAFFDENHNDFSEQDQSDEIGSLRDELKKAHIFENFDQIEYVDVFEKGPGSFPKNLHKSQLAPLAGTNFYPNRFSSLNSSQQDINYLNPILDPSDQLDLQAAQLMEIGDNDERSRIQQKLVRSQLRSLYDQEQHESQFSQHPSQSQRQHSQQGSQIGSNMNGSTRSTVNRIQNNIYPQRFGAIGTFGLPNDASRTDQLSQFSDEQPNCNADQLYDNSLLMNFGPACSNLRHHSQDSLERSSNLNCNSSRLPSKLAHTRSTTITPVTTETLNRYTHHYSSQGLNEQHQNHSQDQFGITSNYTPSTHNNAHCVTETALTPQLAEFQPPHRLTQSNHHPQGQLFTLQSDPGTMPISNVDSILRVKLLHECLDQYYNSTYYRTHFAPGQSHIDQFQRYNQEIPPKVNDNCNSSSYVDPYKTPISDIARVVTPSLLSHVSFILQSHEQIICSTILSLSSSIDPNTTFDVILFEEASQLTIPSTIYPLSFLSSTGRFLLIGDTNQLPPLVRNSDHIKLALGPQYSLSTPLLTLLTTQDWRNGDLRPKMGWGNIALIGSQYRMNEEICRLSNTLVYRGLLTCANDQVAKRRLKLLYPDKVLMWVKMFGGFVETRGQKRAKELSGSRDASSCSLPQGNSTNGSSLNLDSLYKLYQTSKINPMIGAKCECVPLLVKTSPRNFQVATATKRLLETPLDLDPLAAFIFVKPNSQDILHTNRPTKMRYNPVNGSTGDFETDQNDQDQRQGHPLPLLPPYPHPIQTQNHPPVVQLADQYPLFCNAHWLKDCITSKVSTIAINTSLAAPFCYDLQQHIPDNAAHNVCNIGNGNGAPNSLLRLCRSMNIGIYNPLEAVIALQLVCGFITGGVSANDIAILTPFRNQQDYIIRVFKYFKTILSKSMMTLRARQAKQALPLSLSSMSPFRPISTVPTNDGNQFEIMDILMTPVKPKGSKESTIPANDPSITRTDSLSNHSNFASTCTTMNLDPSSSTHQLVSNKSVNSFLNRATDEFDRFLHMVELIITQLDLVKVYTIDQSQGIDLEVVIISSVLSTPSTRLSPPSQLPQSTDPQEEVPKSPTLSTSARFPQPLIVEIPNYKLLADWQRGNVALTRAKNKSIILGDILTLTKGLIDPYTNSEGCFPFHQFGEVKSSVSLPTPMNNDQLQRPFVEYIQNTTESVYAGAMAILFRDRQTVQFEMDRTTFSLWIDLCLMMGKRTVE